MATTTACRYGPVGSPHEDTAQDNTVDGVQYTAEGSYCWPFTAPRTSSSAALRIDCGVSMALHVGNGDGRIVTYSRLPHPAGASCTAYAEPGAVSSTIPTLFSADCQM